MFNEPRMIDCVLGIEMGYFADIYFKGIGFGIRPVVALPSTIEVTKNGDT